MPAPLSASRSSATVRTVITPGTFASSRVCSTIRSNRASSSGADCSMAARWAATVSSSPRATGPVRARSGPSAAQFSTVWRTSGASSSRAWAGERSAPAAMRSAAALRVTRKFEATEAAAW